VYGAEVLQDARGFFMENFSGGSVKVLGLPPIRARTIIHGSVKGVVVVCTSSGEPPMGKLRRVSVGRHFLWRLTSGRAQPPLESGLASKRRPRTSDSYGVRPALHAASVFLLGRGDSYK